MKYEFDITNQLGRKGRKKRKITEAFFTFIKAKLIYSKRKVRIYLSI